MLDSHFKVKERLKKSRDQLYFSQKRNTSEQERCCNNSREDADANHKAEVIPRFVE